MRKFWKATLAVLSFTAFVGVAGCASAQPTDNYGNGGYPNRNYDNRNTDNGYGDPYANGDPYAGNGDPYAADPYGDGYGAPDGVPYDVASGGYCDEWGCPDDYYDMPLYYGPVYYGGSWFNGPLYYRDYGGSRQYWLRGGWHYDSWRGARPSWYRQGRYGPALGRDFYRSGRFGNSFAQRGGSNRGFGNRSFGNRSFGNNANASRFGNRSFGSNANAFGNRSFAAPAQAQNRSQAFNGARFGNQGSQGFQRSDAGRQDRFQNRGGFQRSQAQPQAQPRNDGGNRQRGGGERGNRGRSR